MRIVKILLGLGVVALVSILIYRAGEDVIENGTSPWFGRGPRNVRIPYTIVIGPVDAKSGIAGVLEIDMPLSMVYRNLGEPILYGMDREDAARRRDVAPEDLMEDFMGGVFAWVMSGGPKDTVIGIRFDMEAYRKKFGGQQKVLLIYNNQHYLLDESISLDDIVRMLKQNNKSKILMKESSIILLDTHTGLNFNAEKRLKSVILGLQYRI
ncbi:MAG: hypothetical protein ACYC0V_17105 [Armatimonadota bacterium]